MSTHNIGFYEDIMEISLCENDPLAILMSTHNIGFYEDIMEISPCENDPLKPVLI